MSCLLYEVCLAFSLTLVRQTEVFILVIETVIVFKTLDLFPAKPWFMPRCPIPAVSLASQAMFLFCGYT